MINPIDNYALTSGQPGVINEEAYTVLQLVGQIGAKTNECAAQVNENTTTVNTFDERVSNAETKATEAKNLSEQNAGLLNVMNGKILEIQKDISVPAIDLENYFGDVGEPGRDGELNLEWDSGALPTYLYPALALIKRNLLADEPNTGNVYEFIIRSPESRNDEGLYQTGSLKIYLIPRNSAAHGSRSSFTFDLNLSYYIDSNDNRGDVGLYTIFGSGEITNGDYSASGIPIDAIHINKHANWIYNNGQIWGDAL